MIIIRRMKDLKIINEKFISAIDECIDYEAQPLVDFQREQHDFVPRLS